MLATLDAALRAAPADVEALAVYGGRYFNLDGMQADDATKVINHLDVARGAVPWLASRHRESLGACLRVGPMHRRRVVVREGQDLLRA